MDSCEQIARLGNSASPPPPPAAAAAALVTKREIILGGLSLGHSASACQAQKKAPPPSLICCYRSEIFRGDVGYIILFVGLRFERELSASQAWAKQQKAGRQAVAKKPRG